MSSLVEIKNAYEDRYIFEFIGDSAFKLSNRYIYDRIAGTVIRKILALGWEIGYVVGKPHSVAEIYFYKRDGVPPD
jgi:hypothetical protein